jgi:hypothetical protein
MYVPSRPIFSPQIFADYADYLSKNQLPKKAAETVPSVPSGLLFFLTADFVDLHDYPLNKKFLKAVVLFHLWADLPQIPPDCHRLLPLNKKNFKSSGIQFYTFHPWANFFHRRFRRFALVFSQII